jgi:hypothetical protein
LSPGRSVHLKFDAILSDFDHSRSGDAAALMDNLIANEILSNVVDETFSGSIAEPLCGDKTPSPKAILSVFTNKLWLSCNKVGGKPWVF